MGEKIQSSARAVTLENTRFAATTPQAFLALKQSI
jgi:hypothetical protein